MKLRSKLILIFFISATSLLLVFSYIAFNSAYSSNNIIKENLLSDLSEYLMKDIVADIDGEVTKQSLTQWAETHKTEGISILFQKGGQLLVLIDDKSIPNEVLKAVLVDANSIGVVSLDNRTYNWGRRKVPSSDFVATLIQVSESTRLSLYVEEMWPPLLLITIFLFWISAWGAIVLSKLLDRLDAQKEKLQHQATHDALSGLPNRTLLYDRIQQQIFVAEREKQKFALLFIDMDKFKNINDTLGHHYGDEMLKEISMRLQQVIRKSDTAARIGGDEFAVLLRDISTQSAEHVCDKILTSIEAPVELSHNKFYISASIGLAIYPDHAMDTEALVKRADLAMYEAKYSSDRFHFYDQSIESKSESESQLMKELKMASTNKELYVQYQPVINLKTGAVEAAEALLCWQHQDQGTLYAEQFIKAADLVGLSKPLCEYMLDNALFGFAELKKEGLLSQLMLNLSLSNLQDAGLYNMFKHYIQRDNIHPSDLVVEIANDAFTSMNGLIKKNILLLKEAGVNICVDNFGRGPISWLDFQDLAISELQVDRQIALTCLHTPRVQSVLDIARTIGESLKIKITVEGIESEEIMRHVMKMGFVRGQGFYLCPPMPIGQFKQWLGQQGAMA